MRIVLDASGGDFAPREPVKAAVQAARALDCTIILVGPEQQLHTELQQHNTHGLDLQVVDARQVIGMDEHPAQAIRRKTNSSHIIGLRMVRDGKADAFVSAGHSGASMAGALLILGRLPGIDRPAVGALLPQVSGPPVLVVDAGANTDCKPEYLLQFGVMGSIYAEHTMGRHNPRVGLLANGEEQTKGDKLVQDAHILLLESSLRFIGNVEPKDVMTRNACDVVVSDGFVGNLLIKMGEATVSLVAKKSKRALKQRMVWRMAAGLLPLAALTALPGAGRWRTVAGAAVGTAGVLGATLLPLYEMYRQVDYRAMGGAPLLGVKGVVVIAHGKSDAFAIQNAIRRAHETVSTRTIEHMTDALVHMEERMPAVMRVRSR